MSNAFLTLWGRPQIEVARRAGLEMNHAANAQFRARGVAPGDRVYVVAVQRGGRLLLLGRLDVERVTDRGEAERLLGPDVYDAPDHLLGAGTDLRLDRVIPERIARSLERVSGLPIAVAPDAYVVDPFSLRATGLITERSAGLLDDLLVETLLIATGDEDAAEGSLPERRHRVVEGSRELRALALANQGTDCAVCRFSFAEAYGPLGEGFAEIHHLGPIAELGRDVWVHPARDVVVLCANCHRMVHRTDPPGRPEELREALRSARPRVMA